MRSVQGYLTMSFRMLDEVGIGTYRPFQCRRHCGGNKIAPKRDFLNLVRFARDRLRSMRAGQGFLIMPFRTLEAAGARRYRGFRAGRPWLSRHESTANACSWTPEYSTSEFQTYRSPRQTFDDGGQGAGVGASWQSVDQTVLATEAGTVKITAGCQLRSSSTSTSLRYGATMRGKARA